MELDQKVECAIDAIDDAIENRKIAGHTPDSGLDWAKELIGKPEELQMLIMEKHLLQQLWVTVNLSCDPPKDCNDPVILKRYMKACMKKADEYEAFKDKK